MLTFLKQKTESNSFTSHDVHDATRQGRQRRRVPSEVSSRSATGCKEKVRTQKKIHVPCSKKFYRG